MLSVRTKNQLNKSGIRGFRNRSLKAGAAALVVTFPVMTTPQSASAQTTTPTSCGIATQIQTNGGFETPNINPNTSPGQVQTPQGQVPGWSTTDSSGLIEIWESNFAPGTSAPTPSFEGGQFAELNAREVASLSQSGAATGGAELFISWAHRARASNSLPPTNPASVLTQIAEATISDNVGTLASTGSFSADSTAWVEHTFTTVTNPAATQFTMTFTSLQGGERPAQGNFLDGVQVCQTFITLASTVTGRDDVDGSGGDSAGDTVDIQHTISNPAGNLRPLGTVTIQDDLLGTIVITSPDSGDTDGDGVLDPGETWIITRPYTLDQDDLDDSEPTGFTISPDAVATGDTSDNVLTSNETNYSFPVTPQQIATTNDTVTGVDGLNGETDVLNVLTGDTLGTDPATTGEVTIGVATGSSVPPELSFDTSDGSVDVLPGTPSGTYSFDYEICEILNPTNCETATATVVVDPAPQFEMTKVADDDEFVTVGQVVTYTYQVTNTGNENISNVTINDVHNGAGPAPTPANETLTTDSGTTGDSTDATANDGVWDVLAPGDVVTFTGTYIVQQADIDNLQ